MKRFNGENLNVGESIIIENQIHKVKKVDIISRERAFQDNMEFFGYSIDITNENDEIIRIGTTDCSVPGCSEYYIEKEK